MELFQIELDTVDPAHEVISQVVASMRNHNIGSNAISAAVVNPSNVSWNALRLVGERGDLLAIMEDVWFSSYDEASEYFTAYAEEAIDYDLWYVPKHADNS
jgi:hypothetical protein